jgi:hypothetical protein
MTLSDAPADIAATSARRMNIGSNIESMFALSSHDERALPVS